MPVGRRNSAFVFALSFLLFIELPSAEASIQPRLLYQFNRINFTFNDQGLAEKYWSEEQYKNVVITGCRKDKDNRIFVTLPRWSNHTKYPTYTPATLALVKGDDLLEPYPSWAWNDMSGTESRTHRHLNCALGLEIDQYNYMWVLDQGRAFGNEPHEAGAYKLVKINLDTDHVNSVYYPKADVINDEYTFLNDLVIDHSKKFIYMSDCGLASRQSTGLGYPKGSLVLFNMETEEWRKVLYDTRFTNADITNNFFINGFPVMNASEPRSYVGTDGIALHPYGSYLVWCSLSGKELWSVPTHVLRDWSGTETEFENRVQNAVFSYHNKTCNSDGIAFGENGHLFYTMLGTLPNAAPDPDYPYTKFAENGIMEFNPDTGSQSILVSDNAAMMWPDGIGFVDRDNIIFTSNQLHHFNAYEDDADHFGLFETNGVSYRIWEAYVGTAGYMVTVNENEEGSTPHWWEVVLGLIAMFIAFNMLCCIWSAIYCYKQVKWRVRNAGKYGKS